MSTSAGGPPVATAKSADATAVVHRWGFGGTPPTTGGLRLISNPGKGGEKGPLVNPVRNVNDTSIEMDRLHLEIHAQTTLKTGDRLFKTADRLVTASYSD